MASTPPTHPTTTSCGLLEQSVKILTLRVISSILEERLLLSVLLLKTIIMSQVGFQNLLSSFTFLFLPAGVSPLIHADVFLADCHSFKLNHSLCPNNTLGSYSENCGWILTAIFNIIENQLSAF